MRAITQSRWRLKAAPIIAKVLYECQGKTEAELRKALHAAYPFGERSMYPYKVWLDEVKRQKGLKWPIGHKIAWENNLKRRSRDQRKLEAWEAVYGKRDETAG
jgi:hypothetical protein